MPAAAVRARNFLLLPFRNVTRGVAQDWLVVGAPVMLGQSLSQFHDLNVVPEERLTAARRRLGIRSDSSLDAVQLRRLAAETGGWTAVTGNILASGTRVRIVAQAMDVNTSRVIVRAETEVAADADVRHAFDQLSVRLLEAAGIPRATSDLASITTTSLDAYRAYVQGVDYYQRSAYRRAHDSFSEAVRLDSTFALAWAKLAFTGMFRFGLQSVADPMSPVFQAGEQAARFANRLPPRQAQLIRATQAWFRGQTTRSRHIADSLVSTDRDDLDALEWLAYTEIMDPLVDTTVVPPRRRASLNRGIRLAREVLDRDPERLSVYSAFAFAYGVAAGFLGGDFGGHRREASSYALYMMRPSDVRFVPVLRDSFELLPRPEFDGLPALEQMRLRRRSADAGMEWVERWLTVLPGSAEVHMTASRLAELQGNFARSLAEVAVAESLGVESMVEDIAGRRLGLLVLAGRMPQARALADSLVKAGALPTPFIRSLDRRRPYVTAVYLLTRQWAKAGALGALFGPTRDRAHACEGLRREMAGFLNATLPDTVLQAVMDTVAMNFREVYAAPSLQRCAESLASNLIAFRPRSPSRPAARAALLAAADAFHASGDETAAVRAARAALTADSASADVILARPWFAQHVSASAVGRWFMPVSAVSFPDSVVFVVRPRGSASVAPDSAGLRGSWFFDIRIAASGSSQPFDFRVGAGRISFAGDEGPISTVPDLVAMTNWSRAGTTASTDTRGSLRPTVSATSEGFRIVVKDWLAADLRRLRPSTAVFSASSCMGVREGLCASPSLVIDYR